MAKGKANLTGEVTKKGLLCEKAHTRSLKSIHVKQYP